MLAVLQHIVRTADMVSGIRPGSSSVPCIINDVLDFHHEDNKKTEIKEAEILFGECSEKQFSIL